jgi:hypothetical protein
MRTLFAISIIALLALLWASISIAQHVRRARRRRRALADAGLEPMLAVEDIAAEVDFSRPAPAAAVPFANPNRVERIDWAYFNKDLGDLSDPYQDRRSKPRGPSTR